MKKFEISRARLNVEGVGIHGLEFGSLSRAPR